MVVSDLGEPPGKTSFHLDDGRGQEESTANNRATFKEPAQTVPTVGLSSSQRGTRIVTAWQCDVSSVATMHCAGKHYRANRQGFGLTDRQTSLQ